MASMVLGDSTLESLPPSVNALLILYLCQREVLRWATLLGEDFKCPISFPCWHTIQRFQFQPVFLFPFFSCCIKSGHQPQEDLASSSYKTNKVLGILLHVGEPLEPINQIWRFQKKKAKNLPKSSQKILVIS